MAESRAQFIITAVDKATATLRNVNRRVSEMTQPARDVQRAMSGMAREGGLYKVGKAAMGAKGAIANVGSEAGSLAGKLAAIGGIAGFAIKKGLIDTAAEFEKYGAILETVEGSQEKAKKSLSWVSDFATTTPFELGEVTQAFVRLRAYGMDPTNGLLRTLGDTGSAMGKPIMSAVEAIADAVTGENERLKEFGIKGSTKGNKTRYEYTDKDGKQQFKIVDKNNRKMIESTLSAIWNEKYAGASERQSKTWTGMISNIKDQWTRFAIMIMDSGMFDWMKGKLAGVLDRINEMAANGKLKEWANKFSDGLMAAMKDAWAFAKVLKKVMLQVGAALVWMRDLFGGWRPVIYGIIAIMAGPLLVAIAGVTQAIIALGIAFGFTPIGWALAGIAAIVAIAWQWYKHWASIKVLWNDIVAAISGAAGVIYKVWEPISKWWHGMIDSIGNALDRMVQRVAKAVAWLKGLVSWIPGMGDDGTASAGAARGPVSTMGGKAQTVRYPGAAGRQAEVGGTIRVQIDSEGRPKVKEVRRDKGDVNFDVDAGMMMAAAH